MKFHLLRNVQQRGMPADTASFLKVHMLISMVSAKGGVGKSTITVHLAGYLARLGRKVALIDADPQMHSSAWLRQACPSVNVFTLQTADEVLEEIPRLRAQYDDILIDCPGGLSDLPRTVLFISDLMVLPCGPTFLDLSGAQGSIRVARQVQAMRSEGLEIVLIPNKIQKNKRLSQEFLETAKSLELRMTSGLRLLQAYADAPGQGQLVWNLGRQARDAALEMQNLFKEIFAHELNTQKIHDRSVANG